MKKMKREIISLTIYSFTHFWVDLACAYLIYSTIAGKDWYICLLIYNFCAFALQMPLGMIADFWNKNARFAALGCILVAVSCVLGSDSTPILVCLIAGTGNAMFHVGGGLDVLNDCFGGFRFRKKIKNLSQKRRIDTKQRLIVIRSGKRSFDKNLQNSEQMIPRCAPLGIFVSPGALGLFLGKMWGQKDVSSLWVPTLLLCLAAALIFIMNRGVIPPTFAAIPPKTPAASTALPFQDGILKGYPTVSAKGRFIDHQMIRYREERNFKSYELRKQSRKRSGNAVFSLRMNGGGWIGAGLFFVVVFRSHISLMLDFDWKSEGLWGIGLIAAVVLGKVTGGFLSDRIGTGRVIFLSLGLAAILFLFSQIPLVGIIAVFFLNMTMPATLFLMANLFPGAKGFSFGLLTFALFIGFSIVFSQVTVIPATPLDLFGLCIASIVALCISMCAE